MTNTETQRGVPMRRYGLQLVGLMLLLGVMSILASQLLSFELPSAMGVIILIASLTVPANRFAVNEGRRMTAGERARLGLWAALGMLVIGVVMVIGVLLWAGVPLTAENAVMAMFGDLDVSQSAALLIMLASAVLTFVIVFACAGFMTRGQLKALEKQAARGKG